jgi:glycosyltransferase involved in cell wall biosynthesis
MTATDGVKQLAISVVIPTFRRPLLLTRCLEGLAAQRLDPRHFEVVVADDARDDETRRVVERAATAGSVCFRYVAVTGTHGPAAARNVGWKAARADVVAFTDDDCVPEPGWLAAGLSAFGPDITGVQGRLIVPRPPVPTDHERNTGRLEEGEFITANCFYRRAALAAVGGFDERFPEAWREDSDLFFTLLEQGGRFGRAPDAVVVHPVRPAGWGSSVRDQRKSMFNALLYKKHPALYRERIQRRPPLPSYASLAALLAGAAGAVAGRRRWVAAAAVLWVALTSRFCARRLASTSRAPRHVAEMVITSAIIPSLSAIWRLRGAVRYRVRFL